jgi:hypothetical protein
MGSKKNDNVLELESSDVCLVLSKDGDVGIIVPRMEPEDIVPDHIMIALGILCSLHDDDFSEAMREVCANNIESMKIFDKGDLN